ncbi:MAG: calcium/sodium antiporter [Methanobacteriaceae archaeon]
MLDIPFINIILPTIGIIVALILVIKAADVFVDNIVEIGSALGVSQIILGVTAAAIGTSLPEFGSALLASLSGSTEMGLGVVIGSNIWNIAGILGITAAFTGFIHASGDSLKRDAGITIVTTLVLIASMSYSYFTGSYIPAIASIIMIAIYIIYFRILVKDEKKSMNANNGINIDNANTNGSTTYTGANADNLPSNINVSDECLAEGEAGTGSKLHSKSDSNSDSNLDSKSDSSYGNGPKGKLNPKSVIYAIISIAILGISCKILVDSASSLATIIGIPEAIMGLFTLSIGTSIPELVVTFSSAVRGLHDLSIGTIFGSVTFNILIGIGVPALLMQLPVETLALYFDAPVMLGVIILTMFLIRVNGMKLNRTSGLILIGVYIAYAVLRIGVLPGLMA